jgi:hypothetical protein
MAERLSVSVFVGDDDDLSLQPGFVTETGSSTAEQSAATMTDQRPAIYRGVLSRDSDELDARQILMVELLDGANAVLSRTPLVLSPVCSDGPAQASGSIVSGHIGWSADAAAVRFSRAGKLLHTEVVPKARPEISLTWEPREPVTDRRVITWEAGHPEGRPLVYLVLYSPTDGLTWETLSFPQEESRFEVPFDELPGGSARLAVLASDGINTARAETAAFAVPIKPLFCSIQSPREGDVVSSDTPVWLLGQAFDKQSRQLETDDLVWTSSRQGELGRGGQVVASLRRGEHTITLRAGTGDRAGQASVSVSVRRTR